MKLATKYKMMGAHLLYKAVRLLGVKRIQEKTIDGVVYKLDLAEGIDLSMFLFGGFQKHVISRVPHTENTCTVLDVGANVGMMTLQFAHLLPNAVVHAFEPSVYANARLDDNCSLNPELSRRVVRVPAFVSDVMDVANDYTSYSSWRVDDLRGGGGAIPCISVYR